MSRKNKAYRAWYFQNQDGTPQGAWDAAWANQQGCFASRKHEEQQARIEELNALAESFDALLASRKHEEQQARIDELEAENKVLLSGVKDCYELMNCGFEDVAADMLAALLESSDG